MKKVEFTSANTPVACLAPELTDEAIAYYEELALQAIPQVRDAMLMLLSPVKAWWDLPVSTRKDSAKWAVSHRTDIAKPRETVLVEVVPLEESHVKSLDGLIPWEHELEAIQNLFEKHLDPGSELSKAAHHLLWYCIELNNDREPLTQSSLNK